MRFLLLSFFLIYLHFYSGAQNAIYTTGVGSGYAMSTAIVNITLPIELLRFEALKKDASFQLNWVTATETNNNYFTIEKSKSLLTFKELVTIAGAGNSSGILHYSAIDTNPYPGISYYRLKQTDYDGKYSYSPCIAVNFNENKHHITVYTDKDEIYVRYTGLEEPYMQISILDIYGREIIREEFYGESNSPHWLSTNNAFEKGTYFVRVSIGNTEQFLQKIIY